MINIYILVYIIILTVWLPTHSNSCWLSNTTDEIASYEPLPSAFSINKFWDWKKSLIRIKSLIRNHIHIESYPYNHIQYIPHYPHNTCACDSISCLRFNLFIFLICFHWHMACHQCHQLTPCKIDDDDPVIHQIMYYYYYYVLLTLTEPNLSQKSLPVSPV